VTLFDLLFLLCFLAAVVLLLLAAIAVLRGHLPRAKRLLGRLVIGAAVYLAALLVASLIAHGREIAPGQEDCSDDWCIAVVGAARSSDDLSVEFRLASHAGRVSQRERYVVAYAVDGSHTRYDAGPSAGQPPFDTRLGPLASVTTIRHFPLPAAARAAGVVIAREGMGRFPGCCIIGGEGSLLHPPDLFLLP
jgi:hypothetical protein